MDFQGALEAARFEYLGHFMSSAAATYAGTSIELLAGVLLAIGVITRYAAQAFLLIQSGFHLPASRSMVNRPGLSESAVPLIPGIIKRGWCK
jgi:uncharacterized membrane protein YphA (DoxX/SURF4 family)